MIFKQKIGLHLKLTNNLSDLTKKAIDYNLNCFQFFLLQQHNGKYINFLPNDVKEFLSFKQQYFSNIYIHCSYWINIATTNPTILNSSICILKKEIKKAKKLGINSLVLHPGCASKNKKTQTDPLGKIAGIQTIAKVLNSILKKETEIEILLENIDTVSKDDKSKLFKLI
ncbi:TIM barrel protein, partial [Candidatus Dependentiae bacterium]